MPSWANHTFTQIFVPFLKNPFWFDEKWIFKLKNGGLGHFLICNGQKWPKMGKNVGFGQIVQKNCLTTKIQFDNDFYGKNTSIS